MKIFKMKSIALALTLAGTAGMSHAESVGWINPSASPRMSWIRPRGESASCPVWVNVGHAGRHSPQCTHDSAREYVRGSSGKAGEFTTGSDDVMS